MEEKAQRIAELIKKRIDEVLTEDERTELNAWVNLSDENKLRLHELTERSIIASKLEQFVAYNEEKSWVKLKSQCLYEEAPIIPMKRRNKWWMYAAAAAVLIFVIGYWLVPRFARDDKGDKEIATQEQRFRNDVKPPALNKATLTLEDGRVIVLDSLGNGAIAMQSGARISKVNDQLNYEKVLRSAQDDKLRYNTLTVPKGSKPVKLILADGSGVWLDAESSLTYPTAFVGKDRIVEMTGQAYYEIKKDAVKPFTVKKKADDASVQVLGTHFNVNAFDDEGSIKVTLLEGSVNVRKAGSEKIIAPGQQAQIDLDGRITLVKNVDIGQVMAWKNGMFNFKGARIETIMREVARWYDVEVVYEGKPKDEFVAPISRDVPVSKLLKLLEMTEKVKFRIEGRKVVVMN